MCAGNFACPAILSGIHSGANENTSEQAHRRIPKSRRMSVPLFIKRRLLCALREWRQGDPTLTADHGSRIGSTRPRLGKTRTGANRSGARQAYAGRALRSLLGNDPASEAENDRAKIAHRSPNKITLGHRQTYSGREGQTIACRSLDFTLPHRPAFPQSAHGVH